MKLIRTYIILIICTISCNKVVEFPIPANEPKNVVNVILTADSALGGYMYETTSILSNDSSKPIKDGIMRIVDEFGNQVAYQLFSSSGKYFSNNIAKPNSCYSVTFNSKLGVSEGQACVPIKPSVDIIDTAIIRQVQDTTLNIEIGINDSSSNNINYYRISCQSNEILSIKPNNQGGLDTNYGWVQKILITTSFNYLINDYNYSNTAYLLRDDKFNGNTAYLNFSLSIGNAKKMRFMVDAIDNNLFEYYRTVTAQQFVQTDPNAHYVNVFTNLSNGYGIIGAKNTWQFEYVIN